MEGSGKAEQWIDQTYLGLTWIGYLVLLGYDLVNLGLPAWCTWVYLGLLYAGLVNISEHFYHIVKHYTHRFVPNI